MTKHMTQTCANCRTEVLNTADSLHDAEFRRFGKIHKIWIARKPPGFAFIDYEDSRDAEDAVRKLDGKRRRAVPSSFPFTSMEAPSWHVP
jgi:hypothetical protein